MNIPRDVTIQEAISGPLWNRPHVVILGAGASLAACPQGDRLGRKLPVMAKFTEVVPIQHLVPDSARGSNFELFYSRLASDPKEAERCADIDRIVYEYFDRLELPSTP